MTKRHYGWALIGMLIASLVLGQLYTTLQISAAVDLIRTEQIANVERSKDTKANTETIKQVAERIDSCTTPKGECFRDTARRTQGYLNQISDVDLYVAACALATQERDLDAALQQRLREIRDCVNQATRTDDR